ncbi:MAG: HAMP domain-containing protein [Xenococcaceae cyanobacterium]
MAPGDFTRRIGNRGADDEVGRLAMTFDRMLDRLQLGFDRENSYRRRYFFQTFTSSVRAFLSSRRRSFSQ